MMRAYQLTIVGQYEAVRGKIHCTALVRTVVLISLHLAIDPDQHDPDISLIAFNTNLLARFRADIFNPANNLHLTLRGFDPI